MKHTCDAQLACQICNLMFELDVLLWELYWDEFEAIYKKKAAEPWYSTAHTSAYTRYTERCHTPNETGSQSPLFSRSHIIHWSVLLENSKENGHNLFKKNSFTAASIGRTDTSQFWRLVVVINI